MFTGSLIIVWIAYLALPWIGAETRASQIGVGLLWLVLMVGFEVWIGRLMGRPWQDITADFKIWRGGLLPIGLATLAVSPVLAAKLRAWRK